MVTVALGPFYPKGVIEINRLQSAGIYIHLGLKPDSLLK